jgi:hypothetical protein
MGCSGEFRPGWSVAREGGFGEGRLLFLEGNHEAERHQGGEGLQEFFEGEGGGL